MAKKPPKEKAKKAAKKTVSRKKLQPNKMKPLKKAARPVKKKTAPKKAVKKILKKARPAKRQPLKKAKKIPAKKPAKKIPPKAAKSAPKPKETPLIQPAKPPELLAPPKTMFILPAPKPEGSPVKAAIQREPERKDIQPIMPERARPMPEKKPEQKTEHISPGPLSFEEKEEKPALFQPDAERGGALAVELEPALEQLPAWEDRVRLRRMIFEDGLKFQELSRSSPDFGQAFSLLMRTGRRGFRDVPGYFMVCVRDRSGGMIGALDGHLSGDIMVIGRSAASGRKKRDLHILMYASALSGRDPKYVVFAGERKPLDLDYAGELIFLGRGLGMSAFGAENIIFIRRMGKELDPLSTGQEMSMILSAMAPLFPPLAAAGAEIETKSVVALVPLPSSPDSREHLHEVRDAAESLGLKAEDMDGLLEELKRRYISGREDITPDLI